ncbi:hypothetical protein [uncultured Sphingomonas sp.]|uniref:hypothetical protein n=1 Tax=uncultured Sphingomonas sp. TaxID=158754 RepID=UPI0025EE8182|nr:hypothetical protein [uncultured Sphingomonas sp.]
MSKMLFFAAGLALVVLLVFAVGKMNTRARTNARRSRRVKTIAFERSWNQFMRRHDKPKQITYSSKDPARRD